MIVRVITDIAELDITKENWDALVCENETNSIFQTYDWFNCWWSVYKNNNALFFVAVYNDNNTLLGFAPLAIHTTLFGKRFLIFVGDGNADYLDFIAPHHKKQVIYHILSAVKQNQHRWNRILLRNIPTFSSTTGLIKSFSRNIGAYSTIESTTVCPSLLIKNREHEARHIANKYSTKRPYNYFKRSGSLNHEIIKDKKALKTNLEMFFEQHIKRWQNTPTPSLFLNEKNKDFYRLLAETLAHGNQLLFSVVRYNNIPLSYHYGFDYNSTVTWYKPSFAVEYARHSPGIVMARCLINYCLDNNKTELDFTIGDEPFKERFTNIKRQNSNLRIFTSATAFYFFCLKLLAKKITKKLLGKR